MAGYNKVGLLGALGAVIVGALAAAPCAWAQDLLPSPGQQVQRQADNPLRWIIEAGKLKGRARTPEPDLPPRVGADRTVSRSAAAKPAARAKDMVLDRTVAAASSAASAPASATPAPAERLARADTAAPPPEPAALELVAGAQPTLPEQMVGQLHEAATLELEFTVTTDGSVAEVSVLKSNNRAVDPYALDLVRAWRFKPIAQAQVHSVQLVFHPRD